MLAFSQQPVQTRPMQTTGELNIQIVPFEREADLFINGRHYILDSASLPTLEHLRALLRREEPEYIIDAVFGVLKEMIS